MNIIQIFDQDYVYKIITLLSNRCAVVYFVIRYILVYSEELTAEAKLFLFPLLLY